MKHFFILLLLLIPFFYGNLYSQDSIFSNLTGLQDTTLFEEAVVDTIIDSNPDISSGVYIDDIRSMSGNDNNDLLIPSIVFGLGIFLMLCLAVFSFTALSMVVMVALGLLTPAILVEYTKQSFTTSFKKSFFFINALVCSCMGALTGYLVHEGYSNTSAMTAVLFGIITGLFLSIPIEIILIFLFRRMAKKVQGLTGKEEE